MLSILYQKNDFSNEDEWVERVVESIYKTEQAETKNDIKLWDIYNGKNDNNKYKYLTEENGLTYPAKFRNIGQQIVRSKINLLESKQSRRIYRFKAVAYDESTLKKKLDNQYKSKMYAVKEIFTQRSEIIALQIQNVEQKLQDMRDSLQAQPENEEMAMQQQELSQNLPLITLEINKLIRELQNAKIEPDEMQKKVDYFLKHTPEELIQQIATATLKADIRKENLQDHWNEGLTEKIVTGKPRYLIYYCEQQKKVVFKNVTSMNTTYGRSSSKWIQDGEWCTYSESMSLSQIFSEFKLTENQKNALSSYVSGEYQKISNYIGNSAIFDSNSEQLYNQTTNTIQVKRVWFLAPRIESYKVSHNKHGGTFINLVKNDSAVKKGEEKKSVTIYDLYQATVLGNLIVVNNGKVQRVFREQDNLSLPPLPLVGRAYGRVNDKEYSVISKTEELVELYNIINYKKEIAICLAGVKGMIMDKSQKPDSMGFKDWMYYRKLGTMWIETMKKGRRTPATFNQFQNFDDTLSETIILYDNLLSNIENLIGNIMGVTPSSQGQFVKDDAVGNVKLSTEQSALVTEILYHDNDKVYSKALDMYLNLNCQYKWNEETIINDLNNDLQEVLIHVPKGTLNKSNFRIYTFNELKDDDRLEDLRQIAMRSWGEGKLSLPSIASIIRIDDITQMEKTLKQVFEETEAMMQQRSMQVEQQKSQLKQEELQIQSQMQSQLYELQNQGQAVKNQLDQARLELDVQKFSWETQFKEKELEINSQIKQMDISGDNEINSAYLEEESRTNRVEEKMKAIELMLQAYSIDVGERSNIAKSIVDLDKNSRNKTNIKH